MTTRRFILGALTVALLLAGCGGGSGDDAIGASTTGPDGGATSAPSTTASSGDVSGFAQTLECDQVLTFDEFNAITGFGATECDGLGGFAGPDDSTIVELQIFATADEAEAASLEREEGLTEDDDRFSGASWTAFDTTGHGATALSGTLMIIVRPNSQVGGPQENLDAAEARRINGLLFDAIVTQHGG